MRFSLLSCALLTVKLLTVQTIHYVDRLSLLFVDLFPSALKIIVIEEPTRSSFPEKKKTNRFFILVLKTSETWIAIYRCAAIILKPSYYCLIYVTSIIVIESMLYLLNDFHLNITKFDVILIAKSFPHFVCIEDLMADCSAARTKIIACTWRYPSLLQWRISYVIYRFLWENVSSNTFWAHFVSSYWGNREKSWRISWGTKISGH